MAQRCGGGGEQKQTGVLAGGVGEAAAQLLDEGGGVAHEVVVAAGARGAVWLGGVPGVRGGGVAVAGVGRQSAELQAGGPYERGVAVVGGEGYSWPAVRRRAPRPV